MIQKHPNLPAKQKQIKHRPKPYPERRLGLRTAKFALYSVKRTRKGEGGTSISNQDHLCLPRRPHHDRLRPPILPASSPIYLPTPSNASQHLPSSLRTSTPCAQGTGDVGCVRAGSSRCFRLSPANKYKSPLGEGMDCHYK